MKKTKISLTKIFATKNTGNKPMTDALGVSEKIKFIKLIKKKMNFEKLRSGSLKTYGVQIQIKVREIRNFVRLFPRPP